MKPSKALEFAPMSFFGLVSFLERSAEHAGHVGEGGPPRDESILFRNDPSLGFPNADVSSVRVLSDGPVKYEVTTTFLGLSGSVSPLPDYIPQSVAEDSLETGIQRDFLDAFHHRAISLFYRAKVRHEPARQHRTSGSDPWLMRLLGMVGVSLGPESALEPRHLMPLLPILARRQRGAVALRLAVRAMVRTELPDAEVEIRELAGGWLTLDEDDHTMLGVRNQGLGQGFMLGRRVNDPRGRFAIRVGRLRREDARLLGEGALLFERVRSTVRLVVRDPLDYDLEILLRENEAQTLSLGSARLGEARLRGFKGLETLVRRNVGLAPHGARAANGGKTWTSTTSSS